MTLQDSIDYLKTTQSLHLTKSHKEAIQKLIDVIESSIDIEAWDEEEKYDTPMCEHCIGNGCASCNGTGDAKIKTHD